MPSKGVDYYTYVSTPNTAVTFRGPGNVGSVENGNGNFKRHHLEMESSNLSWSEWVGQLWWNVIKDGKTEVSKAQGIHTFFGILQSPWDMAYNMNQRPIFTDGLAISWGFYDAGHGTDHLPNADQVWVTVTPDMSDWMKEVAPLTGDGPARKPFSTFALPGAHDAGMNTTSSLRFLTTGAAGAAAAAALTLLFPWIPGFPALLAVTGKLPLIMMDMAMTQKDTTSDMLRLGVRYFDFRPAYLLEGARELVPRREDDTLYHTHLVVPGGRFDYFLADIVTFLKAHTGEIVVVRISADGIQDTLCKIPSTATIEAFIARALSGSGLRVGTEDSLQRPIKDLRSEGTRLIVLYNSIDDDKNPLKPSTKYDSYKDTPYFTVDPSTIIHEFSEMNTNSQLGADITVLQCQGTCTGIGWVIGYTIPLSSESNNPLMSTKAKFDMATLPWIMENTPKKLQAQRNIVLLNDFVDGATCVTAQKLSVARFASSLYVTNIVPPVSIPAAVALARLIEEMEAEENRQKIALMLDPERQMTRAFETRDEALRVINEDRATSGLLVTAMSTGNQNTIAAPEYWEAHSAMQYSNVQLGIRIREGEEAVAILNKRISPPPFPNGPGQPSEQLPPAPIGPKPVVPK